MVSFSTETSAPPSRPGGSLPLEVSHEIAIDALVSEWHLLIGCASILSNGLVPGAGATKRRAGSGLRTRFGSSGPDSGPSTQLQAEATVGDHRCIVPALWLAHRRRRAPYAAGDRVLQNASGRDRSGAVAHLGSYPGASLEARASTYSGAAQRAAVALEYLPGYAPVFRTVECILGYLKCGAKANCRTRGRGEPAYRVPRRPRSMQRCCALVVAWLRRTELL